MLIIHSFLRGIYSFIRNVSKKSYRTCTVLSTGTAVICIVALNSNDFGGSGRNVMAETGEASRTTAGDESDGELDAEAKIQSDIRDLLVMTQNSEEYLLKGIDVLEMEAYMNVVASKNQAREEIVTQEMAVAAPESEEGQPQEQPQEQPQPGITLSGEEYDVLLRIVEAEASGEDTTGKLLVANVILNRVRHEAFPDTVKGVVFQRSGGSIQFSPVADGRYYSVSVSEDTRTAVARAVSGKDLSQGALYFSARSKADPSNMSWFDRNLKWLFEYGGHEFYTLKD